jgi:hypothetical protein
LTTALVSGPLLKLAIGGRDAGKLGGGGPPQPLPSLMGKSSSKPRLRGRRDRQLSLSAMS